MLPGRNFSMDLFLRPAQLLCFHCVPAGVGGWDTRMSPGWCQRGKQDYRRCSTSELRMSLRGRDWRAGGEGKISSQPDTLY